jgi:hypothetical protein
MNNGKGIIAWDLEDTIVGEVDTAAVLIVTVG